MESSWGWPWQGPRSRETGEEAAADAEGPPRASSGAWTLSPGQQKFLFVLQHLNTLILILFDIEKYKEENQLALHPRYFPMTFLKNQSALCPRLEIQAEQQSTLGKGKASFSPPVSLAKGNFISEGFWCMPPDVFPCIAL